MPDNAQIVREFIAAWSDLDPAALAAFFTEDGCYHNMPLDPVRGRAAIETFIGGFIADWAATDWDVLHVATSGDVVFAERIDRTRTTQGNVDLPVVGVFVMENGRIKEWRDYFDLGTYMKAMGA